MSWSTILRKIQQCFEQIPKTDSRADIGPREFLINLVFSFCRDSGKRTLASLRRKIMISTGEEIARSTFWERLATQRLLGQLTNVALHLMKKMARQLSVGKELLQHLGVQGILLLDSSSTTLPGAAAEVFPAPRNNVAPAAIKWHALFDLLQGQLRWFQLTAATVHDRKGFPPLSYLKGKLIIFDLGYYDYSLFKAIANAGGFFLSRVKENANILVLKVISGLPKQQFEGWFLLDRKLPKRKRRIVEVWGELQWRYKPLLEVRVIGFWNPIHHAYHWYLTNLPVPAILIYPLYRLRWQLELVFKSAKTSLRLKDMPSSNARIVQSLVMVALIGTLITFPLARFLASENPAEKQWALSFQRSAMVLVHLADQFRDFILHATTRLLKSLLGKLRLLLHELFDPNYKHRKTSLMYVRSIAEDYS